MRQRDSSRGRDYQQPSPTIAPHGLQRAASEQDHDAKSGEGEGATCPMTSQECVPADDAKSDHHHGERKDLPDRVEHSDDCDPATIGRARTSRSVVSAP